MDRCRPARRPVGHRNHRETNRETDWEWPVGQEMGWGGRAGARIKFRLVDLEHTGSRRVGGRSRDRGVIEKTKTSWSTGRGLPGDLVEVQGARGPAGRVEEGRGPVGRGAGAGQAEVGGVLRARWSSRIRGGGRGGRSTKPVGHRSSEPGRVWTWVAPPRPDGSRVGGPFCKSRDRPVVGEPVGHRSGSAGRTEIRIIVCLPKGT